MFWHKNYRRSQIKDARKQFKRAQQQTKDLENFFRANPNNKTYFYLNGSKHIKKEELENLVKIIKDLEYLIQ